jgi:hypothetical protein
MNEASASGPPTFGFERGPGEQPGAIGRRRRTCDGATNWLADSDRFSVEPAIATALRRQPYRQKRRMISPCNSSEQTRNELEQATKQAG